MREKISTVTIKDCIVQTFRAGGPGGQNQNKRDTAVRIIHEPSGARGESREERTQGLNKRNAFVRMAKSKEFQLWARKMATCAPDIDSMMAEGNLRIEVRENGRWTEISPS
jgi:protein subunit release factor B